MSEVVVRQDGPLLEVVIDRPKKKNSITFAMYDELCAAFAKARETPAIRVLLLSGAGDIFTAGNDLGDFLNVGAQDPATLPPMRFIQALLDLEKPLVVAVNGAAVGIGTTMLLHADLVYASETAKFSTPFVSLGLVPEAASSILLPQRIGTAAATDMLLRGAVLDAARAAAVGLVNEVVPATADVLAFARDRARELAQKPPTAVRLTKALLRGHHEEVRARVHAEGVHFGAQLVSAEAREAFTAFMERRAPDFSKF